MKAFAKILLCGFAVFMAASIAQEWDFFSSAWLGRGTERGGLTAGQKKGAADAVYLYAKMTSHLYGSGGDSRFAERIAASPALVGETLAEVDYLRKNRRVEDPLLMKLEVRGVEPLGTGVQVRTREFWVTRTFWAGSDRESDPTRSEIVYAKYRLDKDGERWRVVAWDFDAPPAEAGSDRAQVPPASPAREPAP